MAEVPDEPQMFDERLDGEFREAAHRAFLKTPELRSVVVVYDYYKDLNDTPGVSKGLWLGASGGKHKPVDAMIGSMGAVLQSAAHILDDLFRTHNQLNNELVEVSKQLLEKHRELESLRRADA